MNTSVFSAAQPLTASVYRPPIRQQQTIRRIKRGIWLYFFLLIFEGALRKWVLPGLANPLLIIRDPIALYVLSLAFTRNLVRFNGYMISMLITTILSVFTAVVAGHGNWLVALFGARIFLLHFPLIFVIGRIFDVDDVVQVGKVMLWLTLPMTVLVVLQFSSPQSAWVNLGVGADRAGAGFSGALGYFRPPGTFSFTNGNTLFYDLSACFIFYGWLAPGTFKRWLLVVATLCLIIAIPISISRSLFFQVSLTIGFTLLAIARKPAYAGRFLLAVLLGGLLLFALTETPFFQNSVNVFLARFNSANEVEGGLEGVFLDRFFGGLLTAITESTDTLLLGYGIGMGTNVGAQLLSGGRTFLVAEVEWGRVVGEMGLLLGLCVILIRVFLTITITLASYRQLQRGYFLPWLLLSFGLLSLAQEGWAQPTSLGFSVFIGGLMLASLNRKNTPS